MKTQVKYLIAIFLFVTSCKAQHTVPKIEIIFLNKSDSTSNMYVVVYPLTKSVTSFLFLIPGFGERAEDVLSQTALPNYAAKQGILTIIPVFKTGTTSFGVDTATQNSFKELVERVIDHYQLKGKRFYIGGFSIGGSCAIKFSELAVKENYKYKPTAVFAIDPPLDFERLYNVANRSIKLSAKEAPNQEAVYFVNRIKKEMGGTPTGFRNSYYQTSPYSYSDTNQTAIKYLLRTPLLICTEPDIEWWIINKGNDYSSINSFDAAAMINELRQLGNNNASIIITHNKGYRKPSNLKNPHSWSIADPPTIVNWLLIQKPSNN